MPYATTAQMIARFTEREVIALTDRTGAGVVDEVQLADAITQAGAEIDAHLGRRYRLPLALDGTPLATAPQILVGLCCDIARYRLTGTEVQETEAIRVRYQDALRMLAKLGSGETVFAESPDLLGSGNANAQGAAVKSNQRCRTFPPHSMGGY